MSNLHGWYYLIQLVTLPMKEHHSILLDSYRNLACDSYFCCAWPICQFCGQFLKVCYLRSFSLVIVYINLCNGFHHAVGNNIPSSTNQTTTMDT